MNTSQQKKRVKYLDSHSHPQLSEEWIRTNKLLLSGQVEIKDFIMFNNILIPYFQLQIVHRIKYRVIVVSSNNQKDDLQRQVQYMQEKYPTHQIITDIGSGLNYKRKGLKTILEYAYKGIVKEVVVAYKDRLCRFGFELFEHILQTQSNAEILVLNQANHSKEQELTDDLLYLLHVFSARSLVLENIKKWVGKKKSPSKN